MTTIKTLSKFFGVALAAVALASCSKEEDIVDFIELENIYSITDDPSDPVKHMQYEIYKEFNVPVYFNDTITGKQIGTDIYNRPVMQYETLDLNWGFDSYNTQLKYIYDYLETDEEKLNALTVVRSYLQECSKSMRPFNVLAVNKLTLDPATTSVPQYYYVGYRTLVLHGVQTLSDPDQISTVAKTIIDNMVLDKIKANSTLVARFAAVTQSEWYSKMWTTLDVPHYNGWKIKIPSFMFTVNSLCYGEPYSLFAGDLDFIDRAIRDFGLSHEEAARELDLILTDIGKYGFIRGWEMTGAYTPDDANEDLGYFVKAIMYLGGEGFTERYGNAPLVMEKFNILYDYIRNELKVEI